MTESLTLKGVPGEILNNHLIVSHIRIASVNQKQIAIAYGKQFKYMTKI